MPFTRAHCKNVPQVDRIGKKEVWACFTSLSALEHAYHNFVLGEGDLKWWLWLATLEQSHDITTAAGITSVRVQSDAVSRACFTFIRADRTECTVEVFPHRSEINLRVRT